LNLQHKNKRDQAMRVVIVHQALSEASPADEQDVMQQVTAVHEALKASGHAVSNLPCTLNLHDACGKLAILRPDVIFHLVESLAGHGRLIHLFPSMLDAMGFDYTGAPAEAMWLTSHKIMAKAQMLSAGLPTPAWVVPSSEVLPSLHHPIPCRSEHRHHSRWIIKSVWEHASVGLEADSIIEADGYEKLLKTMLSRSVSLGGACFGEAFIEGREFNLSLLAAREGVQVLPAAEIIFDGYESGRLRIVGYRAKWDENSYEYHHTLRRFDFGDGDRYLLARLKGLALRCWQVFGLKGYARVDFRVDEQGQPWILEINANPCLSTDAGFAAALQTAGIPFETAVERILGDTHRRST
jgi:D-alanine-D-alanine ligase